ncbi:MAG: helix-turn-helix transcriptional regulator [Holosporales bacterium]|jgi:transcriptional regulator with XRE-family HTH domain|nr:helix-turn-helix transcriptional regulator [Holosporales bacterium]
MVKYTFAGDDVDIGKKIKKRRKELKITQKQLATAAGCTFQQIQKYEDGHTRISIPAFLKICSALHTHPCYFFDKFSFSEKAYDMHGDLEVKLLTAFRTVTNEQVKIRIVKLVEAVISCS